MTIAKPPTEVYFYHLERQPLDKVLPSLLERTLARGWRAVVQAGSEERVEALDSLLWTFDEESFLPHGTSKDGRLERQPIYLTAGDDNPNGAAIRFLVDGADLPELSHYVRVVLIFDGHDASAVEKARAQWRTAKEQGCQMAYWQQPMKGGWERKA